MMPETVPESPTPFLSDAGNFRPSDFVRYIGSYLMGHIISILKKVGLVIFIHYEKFKMYLFEK